jgi:hypothetical protein
MLNLLCFFASLQTILSLSRPIYIGNSNRWNGNNHGDDDNNYDEVGGIASIFDTHRHVAFGRNDGLLFLEHYESLYPSSPMFFVSKACLRMEDTFCVLQSSSLTPSSSMVSSVTSLFIISELESIVDGSDEKEKKNEKNIQLSLEHCFWVRPRCSKELSMFGLYSWFKREYGLDLHAGSHLSMDDKYKYVSNPFFKLIEVRE